MSDSASYTGAYEARAKAIRDFADHLMWALDDHPQTGAVGDYQECEKLQQLGRTAVTWCRTYAADVLSHGELLDARREVMHEIDRMLHLEQVPQLTQIRFWHDRLRGTTSNVR